MNENMMLMMMMMIIMMIIIIIHTAGDDVDYDNDVYADDYVDNHNDDDD